MAKDEVPSAPEIPGSETTESELLETKTQPVSAEQPARRVSKEEEVLQSASENMDADEESSQISEDTKTSTSKPKKTRKSPKKAVLALLILVLLAGVGGAVWKFVLGNKSGSTNSAQRAGETPNNEKTTEAPKSYEPETVAYAFKATDNEPYTIYYRPAGGGERKEATKLSRDEFVFRTDARGSKVALSTSSGLYVSSDSGKSYTKIVSVSGQEQITGVRIANSGSKLLYGTTSDLKTNTVKSVDFDGKNSSVVATLDAAGVLIYGWNDTKNQFFYSKGCTSCDGTPSSYEIYDTKKKTSTPLEVKTASENYIQAIAIDDAFTTVSAVNAAPDANPEAALSGGAAPYAVVSFDVANKKATTVATIGAKGEKNTNGTFKYRTIITGFLAGSSTIYYGEGTDLNTIVLGQPSLQYQSIDPLTNAPFVSDKYVIATTSKGASDFSLTNYTTATKKVAPIFEGDANTVIIGVTTK